MINAISGRMWNSPSHNQQARLRFAEEVDLSDVDEALRLMDVSKASLMDREDTQTQ